MFFILLLVIVIAAAVAGTMTIVAEYERAVVFRLGRLLGVRGPGLIVAVRGIDEVKRVGIRLSRLELPAQEVLTRDDVSVHVRVALYVRVVDPARVVTEVDDYEAAVTDVAQASVRAVVGQLRLERVLHDEEAVVTPLRALLEERTRPWGIEIGILEIEDVELPEAMRRTAPAPPPAPPVSDGE